MEIDDEPKTTPSPNSYLVEELGSYVDAGEPELDVSYLSANVRVQELIKFSQKTMQILLLVE